MTFKRVIAAAILASAALPSVASAGVTITGISGNPGFETGRITYTPGGIGGPGGPSSQNLYIGRVHLTGVDNSTMSAVTFDTYCIDIFDHLQNGTFDLETLALADPTKQAQLQKLLGHTATFIDGAGTATEKKDVSAAIQMAVWEIVNEGGTSGYSLDNGLFTIANNYGTVVPTSRGLAQSYLDGLAGWANPTGYGYRMMTAVNPSNNQRQVFLLAGGVPEPSAWALMIAGFGMIGGAMRSRRKTKLSFA